MAAPIVTADGAIVYDTRCWLVTRFSGTGDSPIEVKTSEDMRSLISLRVRVDAEKSFCIALLCLTLTTYAMAAIACNVFLTRGH